MPFLSLSFFSYLSRRVPLEGMWWHLTLLHSEKKKLFFFFLFFFCLFFCSLFVLVSFVFVLCFVFCYCFGLFFWFLVFVLLTGKKNDGENFTFCAFLLSTRMVQQFFEIELLRKLKFPNCCKFFKLVSL